MHEQKVTYDLKEILDRLDARVDSLEYWRWRIAGGLAVAALISALLTALVVWAVTHA